MFSSRAYVLAFGGIVACNVYDSDLLGTEDSGRGDASSSLDVRDARGDTKGGDACAATDGSCSGGGAGAASGGASGAGGVTGGTGGAAGAGGSKGGAAGTAGATGGTAGAAGATGGAAGASDAADGTGGSGGAAGTSGCVASDAACRDGAVDAEGGIVDKCPNDPAKTDPGACGCGVADTDTDVDGAADCIDGCPTDPKKKQVGLCGCNADDPTPLDAGQAFCLKALLAHRYSFGGTGTVATDSIGAADGAIMGGANATLSGGTLSLTGDLGSGYTTEGYVNLPASILDGLTNATFEVWVTWRGSGAQGNRVWQRIFDFGDQVASGSNQVGNTYLFLTPYATSSGILRAAYSTTGSGNEIMLNAASSFPTGAQQHVAVVVDAAGASMTLYFNGTSADTVAWAGSLAAINHVHSWLGRSEYSVDPEFNGVFDEFRIYKVALSAAQIGTSYAAGPNPPF
ncbi:MAG TPA: LamG-like jellyroll fold domain-containing protein [Polyangiaceae bacterium]|nr:LamG-like jellyroll fold domain-containing protein [Polyangiaceae bacterium]